MKSILNYTDYRKYIRDHYIWKKNSNSRFSFRVFSDKCGFVTSSYIQEVISGKKYLGINSTLCVALAMGLNRKEAHYFELMVRYKRSKRKSEKYYYREMMKDIAGYLKDLPPTLL
jgi:uncharacterized protein (TIGR02147 family)